MSKQRPKEMEGFWMEIERLDNGKYKLESNGELPHVMTAMAVMIHEAKFEKMLIPLLLENIYRENPERVVDLFVEIGKFMDSHPGLAERVYAKEFGLQKLLENLNTKLDDKRKD